MAVERQPTESALPSFSLQHDRRPVRVTAAHCFEPDTLRRGLNARLEDLSRRHILENVGTRPGLQGTLQRAVAFERRHHDDAGLRKFGKNADHCINSAHIRQFQVHQCDRRNLSLSW